MADCPNCQALRDEIEVLKTALGDKIQVPVAFRLSPNEEKVLRVMLKRDGIVTTSQMMDAVYGLAFNPPEEHIIRVYICRIRRRLTRYAIAIQTKWGGGWYMLPEDKAKVAALLEQERGHQIHKSDGCGPSAAHGSKLSHSEGKRANGSA